VLVLNDLILMIVNRHTSDEIVYQFADVLENNFIYNPEKYPAPLNCINRYGLQKAILYWYANNLGLINKKILPQIRSLNASNIRNIYVGACLFGYKLETLTKIGVTNTVTDYQVIDEIESAWRESHYDQILYWKKVENIINDRIKVKNYSRLRFPLDFVYINECNEPPFPESIKHICTICSRENRTPTIRRQKIFESFIQWRKHIHLGDLHFIEYIFPIKTIFKIYCQGKEVCLRCNLCGGQIVSEVQNG